MVRIDRPTAIANMMCVEFLNYFQINGVNIEVYILQNVSNKIRLCISFIVSQFYAKVSDYRAVGRSIRTIQDSYLDTSGKLYLWNGLFFVFPEYRHYKPFTIVSQTPFTRTYMQSNGKGDVVPPSFPNLLVYICKVFFN